MEKVPKGGMEKVGALQPKKSWKTAGGGGFESELVVEVLVLPLVIIITIVPISSPF